MANKNNAQLFKNLMSDIDHTVTELISMGLVREYNKYSSQDCGNGIYMISMSGRNDASLVLYDKHVSPIFVMSKLLLEKQYTLLLYDKGIIQVDFSVCGNQITKERLVFIKKHNRVWGKEEIAEAEVSDIDWFTEEEGIPVFLRFDFDLSNHIECDHPISHLTIGNNDICRIPVQNAISFSEFMCFVLRHFYGIKLSIEPYRQKESPSITELEKKMIHMGWS